MQPGQADHEQVSEMQPEQDDRENKFPKCILSTMIMSFRNATWAG